MPIKTLGELGFDPESGTRLGDVGTGAGVFPQSSTMDFIERQNAARRRALAVSPAVRDRLIAYTNAEVGSQGPQARQAFMESIFNRAVARNQPLSQTLSGSYFPNVTHQRAARGVGDQQRAAYDPVLQSVLAGSNVSNYATGNASGTVGFAGGPQTYAAGGERFGVEGPDRGWWTKIGATGPADGVGYVNQAEVPQGATTNPAELVRPAEGFNLGRFLSNFDFTPAKPPAVAPTGLEKSLGIKFAPLGQRRG